MSSLPTISIVRILVAPAVQKLREFARFYAPVLCEDDTIILVKPNQWSKFAGFGINDANSLMSNSNYSNVELLKFPDVRPTSENSIQAAPLIKSFLRQLQ